MPELKKKGRGSVADRISAFESIDKMISPGAGGVKPKVKIPATVGVDGSEDEGDISASSLRYESEKEKTVKEKEAIAIERRGIVPRIVSKFNEQEEMNRASFQHLLEEKQARKKRHRRRRGRRKKNKNTKKKEKESTRVVISSPATTWSNKWATPTSFKVDPKTFEAPKKLKPTHAQQELLEKALADNDVLFHNKAGKTELLQAFEPVRLESKQSLDDEHTDEYFYIVEAGEIVIQYDGKTVGQAKAGDTFGEMNLLYQDTGRTKMTTTPKKKGHSTLIPKNKDAKLLRLNHNDYRGIVQSQAKREELDKRELLQQVPCISKLLFTKEKGTTNKKKEEQIDLVTSIMKTIHFQKGDMIPSQSDKQDENQLVIIKDGNVKITSDKEQEFLLGPGDHIGRAAVMGSRGKEPTVKRLEALTNGVAYTIEKSDAEKVWGTNYIPRQTSRLDDSSKLTKFECIRSVNLDSDTLDVLAEEVDDKEFTEGTKVLEENSQVEPCLYFVREGIVTLTTNDGKFTQEVGPGGYFGVEKLLLPEGDGSKQAKKDLTLPAKWNVTVSKDKPCVMGVLSLIETQDILNNGGKPKVEKRVDLEAPIIKKQRQLSFKVKSEVTLDDLDMISVLGDGAFGEVWLVSADIEGDKKEFALKKVAKEEELLEAVKREIKFLSVFEHPNIVSLVASFNTEDSMYMLLGLLSVELWDVVHREDGAGNWESGIPEAQAKFYTLLLADTLAFIHSKQYIYRDLKPENVMIDRVGYPVLVDFGFAKFCPDKTYTACGTPNYVAPEIIYQMGHCRGVDYWALGILLYEMISGDHPFFFDGMDQFSVYESITRDMRPPFPDHVPVTDGCIDLVDGLLEKEVSHRLGMLAGKETDILDHKWFGGLNLSDLRARKTKAPWIPPKH